MTDTDIGERTQGICGKGFCIVCVCVYVCLYKNEFFCLNITRGYFFDQHWISVIKIFIDFLLLSWGKK